MQCKKRTFELSSQKEYVNCIRFCPWFVSSAVSLFFLLWLLLSLSPSLFAIDEWTIQWKLRKKNAHHHIGANVSTYPIIIFTMRLTPTIIQALFLYSPFIFLPLFLSSFSMHHSSIVTDQSIHMKQNIISFMCCCAYVWRSQSICCVHVFSS